MTADNKHMLHSFFHQPLLLPHFSSCFLAPPDPGHDLVVVVPHGAARRHDWRGKEGRESGMVTWRFTTC